MKAWEQVVLVTYILLFAAPVALLCVSVYEWLEWLLGKFGRGVPDWFERTLAWIVDAVSWPVPDVGDALPGSQNAPR